MLTDPGRCYDGWCRSAAARSQSHDILEKRGKRDRLQTQAVFASEVLEVVEQRVEVSRGRDEALDRDLTSRMMALKKVSSPTTASDTESSMGKTSPPSAARGPGGRGRSPGDPRGAVAGDVPIVLVAVGRRHQQPDVLPQHLLRGVPEHALGAGVEERDLAALGDADDGVLRGVEDDASSGVFGAPLATSWPSLREPVRGRGSPREGGSPQASPR
jgi:hypothetical protein